MEEQRQGRWRKVRIYLDSYIAASFWMHLLCLGLTGMILQSRTGKLKKRKLVLAAICVACLDTVSLVLFWEIGDGESVLLNLITAGMGLLLGAWIAYGRQRLIKGSVLLLGVTALLAGFLQILPVKNTGLLCLVGALLLPVLTGGISRLFRVKQTQRFLYEAKLCQGAEEKSLPAFLDTGNRLRLPGSRLPVVLVDRSYLTEWIKTAERTMPQRLVVLPYKGVGGKGFLYGVRLQCSLMLENGQQVSGEVAAVAAEHSLFQGCEYRMILQPEVLAMERVAATQEGEKYVV